MIDSVTEICQWRGRRDIQLLECGVYIGNPHSSIYKRWGNPQNLDLPKMIAYVAVIIIVDLKK